MKSRFVQLEYHFFKKNRIKIIFYRIKRFLDMIKKRYALMNKTRKSIVMQLHGEADRCQTPQGCSCIRNG